MVPTIRPLVGSLWKVAVEASYDAAFVAAMKRQIPARRRKWDAVRRLWLFREDQIPAVLALLVERFGGYQWAGTPARRHSKFSPLVDMRNGI